MMRDELLRRLGELPANSDIVVDIGSTEFDIVEIQDVDYPAERRTIALSVHPGDLRDVLAAYQATSAASEAAHEPTSLA